MTAIETAISTHYIPGIRAWGRSRLGMIGVVLQNINGAVEYWANPEDGAIGELTIHAPRPVLGWAETPIVECPVGGGLCFEGTSPLGYRELILPLLEKDDIRGVLRKLGEIHDGYFRTGVAA